MFGWFHKKTTFEDLKGTMDYIDMSMRWSIKEIREEIEALKKIARLREYKKIERGHFLAFFAESGSSEQKMEVERQKVRSEGFHFCHKYENGDEIWVKYEEIKQ